MSVKLNYRDSKIYEKLNCKICHLNNKILNSFGKAINPLLAKKNAAINDVKIALTKIELVDSDSDGFNNLQEILGETNPGDAKSFPRVSDLGGIFQIVAPLSQPRYFHTATRLNDGRVLVCGGFNEDYVPQSSCEMFLPDENKFVFAGNMHFNRYNHSATLLKNGKVLIAGGVGGDENEKKLIRDAELFDPETGKFELTGRLNIPRVAPITVLLNDGRVLIAGGGDVPNYLVAKGVKKLEVYHPDRGKFEVIGEMKYPRQFPTVTVLKDGRVLIAGGSLYGLRKPISSAEVFDPKENKIHKISSMNNLRIGHAAALLNDGRVLIAGGSDFISLPRIRTAEIFDPTKNKFYKTGSMNVARVDTNALLLGDGNVLIAGGTMKGPIFHSTAEIYDVKEGKFHFTSPLSIGRDTFTAVKLLDGRVLVAGGVTQGKDSGFRFLARVETFIPTNKKLSNPEGKIVVSEREGIAPLVVTFNAEAKKDTEVFWEFGDNTTGKGKKINHSYTCTGDYEVIGIFINPEGISYSNSVTIKALQDSEGEVSYTCDIKPILNNKCKKCHGFFADNYIGTYETMLKNGLVVPGNIKDSRLADINKIIDKVMPHIPHLSDREMKSIIEWIKHGALNN